MINRPQLAREEAASPTDTARELAARVPAPIEQILFEVKRLIVGQDRLLERLLIALLSGGHVLLEGVPGLAKTVTVKARGQKTISWPTDLYGYYDVVITTNTGDGFRRRYAGRIA